MAEAIGTINLKNVAKGSGNAILGESPVFLNIYFNSANKIWGYFVNSCPIKIPM